MLKKTITYTDYNDVQRTESFYFNLTKAEILEMELGTTGGYGDMIQKIIDAKEMPTLIKLFKEMVLKAYGEKSDDGKRFIKSPELAKAFSETEAYSIIFMELATDSDAASAFVNGIMPSDLQMESEKLAMAKADMAAKLQN